MNAKIIATGSYAPPTVVTNQDYEKIMDTSDEWIIKRTGIKERRFEEESTAHMASQAAWNALGQEDPESLDCIIVGTFTPDSLIPSVACQVRANLQISRAIPAFDVNAACSGFIFALQTANAYIKAGIYERILVIGVDFNSRILNYEDRGTAILFGDGAGAVILEKGDAGIIDIILGSESDMEGSLYLPSQTDRPNPFLKRKLHQDAYFSMKGSEVFKFAVRVFEYSIRTVLKRNHLKIEDIDYVISHQANQRILDMGAKALKMDPAKFLSNIALYGNTSAGSVPLLLDEANRQGLLKKDMKIVLVAFGGGLSYGASLIKW